MTWKHFRSAFSILTIALFAFKIPHILVPFFSYGKLPYFFIDGPKMVYFRTISHYVTFKRFYCSCIQFQTILLWEKYNCWKLTKHPEMLESHFLPRSGWIFYMVEIVWTIQNLNLWICVALPDILAPELNQEGGWSVFTVH